MAVDKPDDPENEKELFSLFRHLRERVFAGSTEIASRVVRGIEDQLRTVPEESLAASMLVQLTNIVTAWIEPSETDEKPSADQPTPTGDDDDDDADR